MESGMSRGLPIALTAMLVCAMAGCASGPRKTDAERQLDNEIADRVQVALNGDKSLFARHITVRADRGVVTLGGFVWTQPDAEEAERIAESVSGVSRIVNQMELERNGNDNSSVTR
jgi:osmotically-inducible protein OsmY